jgi:hypothetical protein
MQHADGLDFSTVEELDPEPVSLGEASRRRELVMGVLLLLGVLGWSGSQYWLQQALQGHYAAARQAGEERDWDTARAQYAAAAGYRDANARSTEVARLIVERDDHYDAAVSAAGRGLWAECLRATQAVRVIEPNYQDVRSLEAEAEAEVYRAALSGTVALRTDANPRGLYYRTANGWVWLAGSDRYSRVLVAAGAAGPVLYDAPGESGSIAPPPSPTPKTYGPTLGTPELGGRRLMVASPRDGTLSFTPLALDPALYNTYVVGTGGVWALRFNDGYRRGRQLIQHSGYGYFDLAYQRLGSPVTSTLGLPGTEWMVMDLAPGGDRILMADVKKPDSFRAQSTLYIADGAGAGRRLLYSGGGLVGRAQFSPDGQRVLLTAYSPIKGTHNVQQSLMLLDAEGASPPRVLAQREASAVSEDFFPPLGATFLKGSHGSGQIVLAEWNGGEGSLSLLDPTGREKPQARWRESELGAFPTMWAEEPENGDLLVAWQLSTNRDPRLGQRLTFARLTPGRPPAVDTVSLEQEVDLTAIWLRGDVLLYGTIAWRSGTNGENTYSISRLPIPGMGRGEVKPAVIYSDTLPDSALFSQASFWSVGPEMLAYVSEGRLRASTYDKSADVPLESGAAGLNDGGLFRGFYSLFEGIVWRDSPKGVSPGP